MARLLLERPLEECVAAVLRSLGEAIGANRTYVYVYEEIDGRAQGRSMHEWCAEGVAPDPWDDLFVHGDEANEWYQ